MIKSGSGGVGVSAKVFSLLLLLFCTYRLFFPCGLVVCLLGFLCIFFVSCVFVDRVVCFLLFVFWFDFLSLLFLYLILSLPFRVHVLLLFRFCLVAFYYRHGLPARRKMKKSKKNKP